MVFLQDNKHFLFNAVTHNKINYYKTILQWQIFHNTSIIYCLFFV